MTSGVDIAANLVAQAQDRARETGLTIQFTEGDAEKLPYSDGNFDVVVSVFGVMFAPRPERVVHELLRVTRPGGLIALANWTPEGFIGKMFEIFKAHVPQPAIPGIPSPMEWGREGTVRERFGAGVDELRLKRRMARMCFPFDPTATVEFFRTIRSDRNRPSAGWSPRHRPRCGGILWTCNPGTTSRRSRTKRTRRRSIWKSTRAAPGDGRQTFLLFG